VVCLKQIDILSLAIEAMRRLFAPLILLTACTFTPEGEYFKEIPKTNTVDLISLSDYENEDTIRIYQATEFKFEVSTNKGNINDVEVLVDGQSQQHRMDDVNKYSFQISNIWTNFKTGTYDLKITFKHHSYSGSLGDKEGTEIVDVWKKWTLVVDLEAPPKPVLKLSEENGFLKISWDPFLKPNFKSYIIDISLNDSYKKRITLTDPAHAYLIDSAYVTGFRMKYSLSVQTVYTESYATSEFNEPQNVHMTYHPSDSTANVTWNKPRFYGAFKSYKVKKFFDADSTIISSVNDTTVMVKFKKVILGKDLGITLRINPVNNYYGAFTCYTTVTNPCDTKKMSGTPKSLKYDVVRNEIAGTKSNLVCYYNSLLEETDSITTNTPYPVIPVGNFLVYGINSSLVQYDLSSQTESRINVVSGSSPSSLQRTTTGRVSYGYIVHNGFYRYVENIYDFSTSTFIYQNTITYLSSSVQYTNPELSIDGQYAYFYKDLSMYKVNANGLQLIGKLSSNESLIAFREDNPEEFLVEIKGSNDIEIHSSSDLSLKRTILAPAGNVYYQSYDPGSKRILFSTRQSEDIFFVHIETGEIKHIYAYTGDYITYPYRLIGGYLFDGNSNYIKIF
jgi:hypothetical protein